jgi:zinc/manganese transport system ATP-binding protein
MSDIVVEASNLEASYADRVVWQAANFNIIKGQLIAILGPNGAGKSTLLKLILGIMRPSKGNLRVFGAYPKKGNSLISYVAQRSSVASGVAIDVKTLIGLGIDGHRWALFGRIKSNEKRAKIDQIAKNLEILHLLNRNVQSLSGGELQRVLLGTALVSNPQLLLLDEPLASLDLVARQNIAELISKLNEELSLTTLLVAHDYNPLREIVDCVIYVGRGKIAMGPPNEVITTEVLSELYGAKVEVISDSLNRRYIIGIEEELSHPHV